MRGDTRYAESAGLARTVASLSTICAATARGQQLPSPAMLKLTSRFAARSAEYWSHPPECADWRGLDQCRSHGRLLLTPTALAIAQNGSLPPGRCGGAVWHLSPLCTINHIRVRSRLARSAADIQGRAHIHPRTHAAHACRVKPGRMSDACRHACSDACRHAHVQRSNTTQNMHRRKI